MGLPVMGYDDFVDLMHNDEPVWTDHGVLRTERHRVLPLTALTLKRALLRAGYRPCRIFGPEAAQNGAPGGWLVGAGLPTQDFSDDDSPQLTWVVLTDTARFVYAPVITDGYVSGWRSRRSVDWTLTMPRLRLVPRLLHRGLSIPSDPEAYLRDEGIVLPPEV